MAIYRMTKEEVNKRQLLITEDKKKIKDYEKIVKSPALIKKELIKELNDVSEKLEKIMKAKDDQKKQVYKKLNKSTKRRKK